MKTIANCRTLEEADCLRALLEAHGIPAFIPDENAASVVPHHLVTRSGVRLQVAEKDEDEARLLVERRGDEAG